MPKPEKCILYDKHFLALPITSSICRTKYCCNTCLYTLKKSEGRNVCIKHGPVSSLLFTPFFIQPIYYLVESRHPVSLLGSYSQVAFFVGDAAFFIQPIYIYIYIYTWSFENRVSENFMLFTAKSPKSSIIFHFCIFPMKLHFEQGLCHFLAILGSS